MRATQWSKGRRGSYFQIWRRWLGVPLACCGASLWAQNTTPGENGGPPAAANTNAPVLRIANERTDILSRGRHQQVVRYSRQVAGTNGVWHLQTGQYTQLESGLNRWDGSTRKWIPVSGKIEVTDDGAQFVGSEHTIQFRTTADVSDAMTITCADGATLVSHVTGLAYYDRNSGDSVLLGSIRPVPGVLTSDQELVYPDCFTDGLSADLVFHALVALHAAGGSLADVREVLRARRR